MSYNLKKATILKTVMLSLDSLPIKELEANKEHRRLKLYYYKGTTCVKCGRVGTKLIKAQIRHKDGVRDVHKDIFTDDDIMITVDHIIPRSKGGAREDLRNMQVMCQECNADKGNDMPESGGILQSTVNEENEENEGNGVCG